MTLNDNILDDDDIPNLYSLKKITNNDLNSDYEGENNKLDLRNNRGFTEARIRVLDEQLPNISYDQILWDPIKIVTIPDTGLQAAIRAALNKPTGDITDQDMLSITTLLAGSKNISNLAGLESAKNLTYLNLRRNRISDLSPLSGLNNLTKLNLYYNQINNLSPLAGLTNLTDLSFPANQISNISPMAGLTNLTLLDIGMNPISDISPIAGLTKLLYLETYFNPIENISALSGLTNLIELAFTGDEVSDISVLSGLTKLTNLYLESNRISNISALSGLINLVNLNLFNNLLSDEDLVNLYPLKSLKSNSTTNKFDLTGNLGFTENAIRSLDEQLPLISYDQIKWNPLYVNISGTVTNNNSGLSGVNVIISGSKDSIYTTASNGQYNFSVEAGKNYLVTPIKAGYSFTPANKQFTNITNNSSQNFIALDTSQNVSVSLSSINASPMAIIEVPVEVSDLTGKNILSYQFTLNFNSSVLSPNSDVIVSNTLSGISGWSVTPNTNTPGQITIGGFGSNSLSGSGTLLKLKFDVIGSPGASSPLNFSGFIFNNGVPAATTTNGSITVIQPLICGDASDDGMVNAYDAAKALRHAIGLEVLSAQGQLNADVNKDGSITAFDAALILRHAIGLPMPNGVTNTCWGSQLSKTSSLIPAINIYMEKIKNENTGTSRIPIKINGITLNDNIYSISFDIEIDKNNTGSNISIDGMPPDYMAITNKINDNLFRVAVINANGISSKDIQLSLNVSGNSGNVNITKIILNDQSVPDITIMNGKDFEIPTRYDLIGSYPNPFNPSTKIVFQTPRELKCIN